MIKSSSSGKPYFFFNIFAQVDIFIADVFGLSSSESSPLKYLAIFSNSNLTELNSSVILFSGRLYTFPFPI